ncbi:MAG: methylenetetrahydrofolate--tRNA-(uracil(54)-C(5))-methyltransferase (FADH(2)-oxidizing) TrmFO [Alphaproteobacteria bacterium]|nr:methylenetetrahydrofolate--tRNA-(uracil(54)-C(5))-methyltransferase (FADH(2)-oxidizing) TrmFO [Alphaproteobacteria bacterium]
MNHQKKSVVTIIGGGLAGCEAAFQLAIRDIKVHLYEMRPVVTTFAHQTDLLAELVCSNSFRSDDAMNNAVGLLHWELRQLNSLIMRAADANAVPAGSALGIERHGFAEMITQTITNHPNITLFREEVTALPDSNTPTIIATGPLTSAKLMQGIETLSGKNKLAFFDAIAPIVTAESLDFKIIWRQSRYDKGSDYLNCPMNQAQYQAFHQALLDADYTEFKEWEGTPYFEGCLPIEVMAQRGVDTLRFGPMKPVGLTNPHSEARPYAVVQLRQENKYGTLYNMVGFQTKMTYGAQKQVLRMIPGLENAEFARLGGIHRNGFIHSPELLNSRLQMIDAPHLQFAGQITGVEGYVESTAMGLMAALYHYAAISESHLPDIPLTTAHGALIGYISGQTAHDSGKFQPMNCNYGLMPPPNIDLADIESPDNANKKPQKLPKKLKGKDRKLAMSQRAMSDLQQWQKLINIG